RRRRVHALRLRHRGGLPDRHEGRRPHPHPRRRSVGLGLDKRSVAALAASLVAAEYLTIRLAPRSLPPCTRTFLEPSGREHPGAASLVAIRDLESAETAPKKGRVSPAGPASLASCQCKTCQQLVIGSRRSLPNARGVIFTP